MAIETLNFSMEGEYVSMFQVEGAPICIPFTNNTKGFNRSINNDILTFSTSFIALRD